ncbi:MAG TPA: hypothetical protein VGQ52_13845 [Gemmatimonadaceae bacterium]|jgi:hypothetical protein|nr:hypothetical protein [Gemmatimonadaceae bacterium]
MSTAMPSRDETFRVERARLVRAVTPRRGKPYEHSCEREIFVEILHLIDECHGASFTYEEVRNALNAPASQVATAFAFLRERSCIVAAPRRRNRAATDDAFLDGMTEFLAIEGEA